MNDSEYNKLLKEVGREARECREKRRAQRERHLQRLKPEMELEYLQLERDSEMGEAEHLEIMETRKMSLQFRKDLTQFIKDNGGIAPYRNGMAAEYKMLPIHLMNKRGSPLDVMAEVVNSDGRFGYIEGERELHDLILNQYGSR